MKADEMMGILNPLIQRELAAISAIDNVIGSEDDPGYVVLYRATKQGKQASIEQMSSLIRSSGGQPAQSAKLLGAALKMQTTVTKWIGTTPTLRAMRLAQAELVAAYERAYEKFSESLARKCVEKCWHRAITHLTVVSAHIEKRAAGEVPAGTLPMPLDHYFAHEEARACMRCHLDRPGNRGPLERLDPPYPYQYICAACHDEVMSDSPPDLIDKIAALSDFHRHSLVIEKALGRPSALKAEKEVLAKLSGLPPDLPVPPVARKIASFAKLDVTTPPPPEVDLQIHADAGSLDERLYIELLFDLRSVRRNW
jgi:hypothetical protein